MFLSHWLWNVLCLPFLHFSFLLMIDLLVKSNGRTVVLTILDLLVMCNAPYQLFSPGVFGFWPGACFWFSCCVTVLYPLCGLLFLYARPAVGLQFWEYCSCTLASGLHLLTGVFSPSMCPCPQASALHCSAVCDRLLVVLCVSERLLNRAGAALNTFLPKPPLPPAPRDDCMVAKIWALESDTSGFELWSWHFFDVWFWTGYWIPKPQYPPFKDGDKNSTHLRGLLWGRPYGFCTVPGSTRVW